MSNVYAIQPRSSNAICFGNHRRIVIYSDYPTRYTHKLRKINRVDGRAAAEIDNRPTLLKVQERVCPIFNSADMRCLRRPAQVFRVKDHLFRAAIDAGCITSILWSLYPRRARFSNPLQRRHRPVLRQTRPKRLLSGSLDAPFCEFHEMERLPKKKPRYCTNIPTYTYLHYSQCNSLIVFGVAEMRKNQYHTPFIFAVQPAQIGTYQG